MHIHISGLSLLVISIIILYIGRFITKRMRWLDEYNIPASVTAGLLFAAALSVLSYYDLIQVNFNLQIRDFFLLVFFASVGLSSKLSQLMSGGKTLLILLAVVFVFIILQNIIGVICSMLMGLHPINGLLAGSIAFAGGHGTAITWSNYFTNQGYYGTEEFALIAATLGLILGGLIGGPVCHRLIKKKNLIKQQKQLFSSHETPTDVTKLPSQEKDISFSASCLIRILMEIALTITAGTWINSLLRSQGIIIPDFLLVLLVGIFISNIADLFNMNPNEGVLAIFGEISLDLFVVMTLFTLKLNTLSQTALPLLAISAIQSLFIIFFAYHIFFRFAGKNYDAAVMTSGFIGSGLGATPVGMANVEAVTHRFGASPKAMLLIPLLGSFCTDVMNATILRGLLTLPIFGY